jgi:hypothetical protein
MYYLLIAIHVFYSICPSQFVSALPFKFRGQSTSTQTTDDDGECPTLLDAEVDGFNEVVELFFADTSAKTAISNDAIASKELSKMIQQKTAEISDFLIYSRRSLHQRPELMYQEKDTSGYVQSVLRELDIPFSTGWAVNTVQDRIKGPGGYGVVADIGTGEQPCVLLRADMDALPIVELTEGIEEFKSRYNGKMHACG